MFIIDHIHSLNLNYNLNTFLQVKVKRFKPDQNMGNLSSQDDYACKQHLDQNYKFKNTFSLSDQIAQNPHWNNSGISSTKSPKNEQKQYNNSDKIEGDRIHQPLPFFVIHVLIASVISFQNIFIIYGAGQNYDNGIKVIISDLFFIVVFSFINSIYLVSFKTLVFMYTLLDGVLVAQIAALVGLVGSLLLANSSNTTDLMLMGMIPISFFFFVGNFRICIRFANWNSAQIIIYKLAILAGAVCFFQIGAYFMAVNYSYTQGRLEQLDSKVKDFITLYAFGTFEFFRQLFAKICDFDQTAEFKYTYLFRKQTNESSKKQNKQIQMMDIQNI